MTIPKILITAGEPAGIGPELVVKLAQSQHPAQLIVAADKKLLLDTAKSLGLPLEITDYQDTANPQAHKASTIQVIHHDMSAENIYGQLNPANGPYVLETLSTAAKLAMDNSVDAILTGPVHKAVLNNIPESNHLSGQIFSGHTEFFADKAGVEKVVMMLATEGLRVALATTHLPLKDVSEAITKESLIQIIRILDDELQNKFGVSSPKILVLGLNPHAGESGLLGQEEIEIISPLLEELNQELISDLIGPLPADTAFSPNLLAEADAVLAMYHDQGLPVLKFKGFGNAANITLGLPFIRTSVDHGTGLDIAGQNKASLGSLEYALKMTIDLVHSRSKAVQ